MPELNTALLKKRKLKNPVKVRSYDYSIPEPKAKKTKTSSFNNSSANMHIDNGIKKQDVSIVKELTSKPACNEKQVSKNTSTLITKTKPLEIQKERKTIRMVFSYGFWKFIHNFKEKRGPFFSRKYSLGPFFIYFWFCNMF